MQPIIRTLVASLTALAILTAGATAAPRHPAKLPADYTAWTWVATCESGGWNVLGAAYPDSLGITATNYTTFGGRPQPTGPVPLAARLTQITIADRLIHHYHIPIPDQNGCQGAW